MYLHLNSYASGITKFIDDIFSLKIFSVTVLVSFRLEKPVSQLIPYIERLEYDIYGEITMPNTKVAILSIDQSVTPNWTDVAFGVLFDPRNVSIKPVSLSMLRSSLIELLL